MRRRFAGALVLLLVLGCGGPKLAPVSGRVTLNGKPLANAHVSFQPIAAPGEMNPGSGSYAITDADGRYTLRVVEGDRPGAHIGKHRVEIVLRETTDEATDLPRRGAKVVIPARYNRN